MQDYCCFCNGNVKCCTCSNFVFLYSLVCPNSQKAVSRVKLKQFEIHLITCMITALIHYYSPLTPGLKSLQHYIRYHIPSSSSPVTTFLYFNLPVLHLSQKTLLVHSSQKILDNQQPATAGAPIAGLDRGTCMLSNTMLKESGISFILILVLD